MPELHDFRIELDNPSASYKTGDTVIGKFFLNLSEDTTIKEIRLETRGTASTKFYGGSGRTYYGKEKCLRESKRLVYTQVGNQQMTLPAGQYSYDFIIHLPLDIPGSFEHKYGDVRYYLRAVIDRPWKYNHTTDIPFIVVAPYDSNTLKSLITAGIHDEIKHEFLSWNLFSAGKIKFDVRNQANVFTPGETIELIININNKSQVDITQMELHLIKNMKFRASEPFHEKKYKSEVLQEVHNFGHFYKRGDNSLKLIVPPGPYVNLKHCSIIDLNYELDLTIHFSGMHCKLSRQYAVHLLDTLPAAQ